MKRPFKITAITTGVLVLLWIVWAFGHSAKVKAIYNTAEVKRGSLLITIGATGTVEPEEVIDVGAQVAGIVYYFGKDKDGNSIDYGSVVDENMVLAKIDDSLYIADAALANAQLQESQAKLYQAERDWNRAQKLGPSEAMAESSYDAYKAAYEMAKANVAISQAILDKAKRNLNYCTIKSPVKGVIIDRRVNIGQTVVSSLNAPSLFLIAKDLKRMQVWVSVNETDIGNIHPGQMVTFTVDAYPGEIFYGTVGKIRLNATMTQNVVTYTVEVITDNSSGKLFPYLTANAKFEVGRSDNVLLVPNAALRWSPKSENAATGSKITSANEPSVETNGSAKGIVWVQQDLNIRPIKVRLGLSDGTKTEVQSDELQEGLLVITGQQTQQTADSSTTNPFVPQIKRDKGSRGGAGIR
jgi:HlyD family secretion protein